MDWLLPLSAATAAGTVLSGVAAWRSVTRGRELAERDQRIELLQDRLALRDDELDTLRDQLSNARTEAALYRNTLVYPRWGNEFGPELRALPWPPERSTDDPDPT